MSKYVMAIYDLAKKYGENTSDFLKKLEALGFSYTTHLTKLTQEEVDAIMAKFYPGQSLTKEENETPAFDEPPLELTNCNIAITKGHLGKYIVNILDSKVYEGGKVNYEVVKTYTRDTKLDALVLYDQLRFKYDLDNGNA